MDRYLESLTKSNVKYALSRDAGKDRAFYGRSWYSIALSIW